MQFSIGDGKWLQYEYAFSSALCKMDNETKVILSSDQCRHES